MRTLRDEVECPMMRMKKLLVLIGLAVVFAPAAGDAQQRVKTARIPETRPSEWTEEQKAVLGSRAQGDKTAPIWKTCVQNTDLCKSWLPFMTYLLGRTTISAREKEMLILRVAYLARAHYPWGAHVDGGKRTGMTDEEIARVAKGPDAPGWSAHEAALLRAADELHKDQFVSDATWKRLDEKFDDKQLLETVFIIGQYELLSMYTNSAGIQREGPNLPK